MNIIPTIEIQLDRIVENRGQVDGLQGNPRKITIPKLRKLVQSIRDYPDMLALRELLVYPYGNKYIVIGGNMRLKALKQLGYTTAPAKVLPPDTPADTLRAYMLRDNTHYGEWDFTPADFDFTDLATAALEPPRIDLKAAAAEAIDTADVWKPAGSQDKPSESLCDLSPRPGIYLRDEFAFCATFHKSSEGVPLSLIKTGANVALFATAAEDMLRKVLRLRTGEGWCIVTTPPRRHKAGNFATLVCRELADRLRLPFHEGFATARNRDRLHPAFTPLYGIDEPNIIMYDDIFTTGSTVRAMLDLLPRKNVFCIIGINNN